MLRLVTEAVTDRSARGIAVAVSRLVSTGALAPGARLPTVRDVARELGISPTTVSEAWSSLARAGAIETRGRSGTFVRGPASSRDRLRYTRLGRPALPLDLSTGVPDHALLPSLGDALRRIGDTPLTTSYLDEPVLPGLEAVLRDRWPYPPEQLTVVDGALDAIDRVVAHAVSFGDHVLVESPAFPPVLDLLEAAGATVVGVPLDGAGIVPSALLDALALDPVALFLQPRAHNPTGVSMTAARAAERAAGLAGADRVLVVEDDHAGDIATAPPVSLGTWLPARTVRVHSFSKSHGPDLRLAAVGGPASVITAITDRRLLGPGWSSRLLQAVLVDLLTDPSTVAQIDHARKEYARRRAALLAALADRGAVASAADGINLWLEVADQQIAMISLAAHGIAVAPGAPFEVSCPPATSRLSDPRPHHPASGRTAPPGAPAGAAGPEHVRVTVGLVEDGVEDLADLLAEAAGTDRTGSGRRARSHPRGWR